MRSLSPETGSQDKCRIFEEDYHMFHLAQETAERYIIRPVSDAEEGVVRVITFVERDNA